MNAYTVVYDNVTTVAYENDTLSHVFNMTTINASLSISPTMSPETRAAWQQFKNTNEFCYRVVFPILFCVGVAGLFL